MTNYNRAYTHTAMAKLTDTNSSSEQNGLIVSRFGNQADVEDSSGNIIRCHIRRSLVDLVAGDVVLWQEEFSSNRKLKGVITQIQPRRCVLTRHIRYEGIKPVAANLDRVFVVTAPEPPYSSRILDRYLTAIEIAGIELVILLNKSDRLIDYSEISESLRTYSAMGYQVIPVSAISRDGFSAFTKALAQHTSIFVGQSGVGKSSLVNTLLPDVDTSVSELSETSGLGTHTTTVSRIYHLPNGGNIIDSPGIREFTMGHIDKAELAQGFRDFFPYLGYCKFRNCRHISEPGCAILAACNEGKVDRLRLKSYHILYEESETE